MALKDNIKNTLNSVFGISSTPLKNVLPSYGVKEKTKGATLLPEKKFPQDVGIEHPFNFKELEKWYTDDPFVNGVVEKHVDFIMGGGLRVISENSNVADFCNQKMREFEFQTLLRDWIKRALVTGNGFLEIFYGPDGSPIDFNVLDSKYMYVRLKKKDGKLTNDIEGYSQFVDFKVTPKPILFKPKDIAFLPINIIDDNPYGIGIIRPLTYSLYKKVGLINDMCMLVNKKAGTRMFIKVGDKDKNIIPSDAEVQAFGERLETETGLTGYVVGPFTEPMIVDYGDIGKNFIAPMQIIDNELIYGSQVPQVLMGMGNIAEGLAAEQGKTWMYRIRSFQEDIEKVIEQDILTPLLISNGFNPEDAEIEWGSPSPDEKRNEILMLQGLLNSAMYLTPDFTTQIEKRLRELLEFEVLTDEMLTPQPRMPPMGVERPVPPEEGEEEE